MSMLDRQRRYGFKLMLYRKQRGRCIYCHRFVRLTENRQHGEPYPDDAATLDHLIPRVRAKHLRANLVIACYRCNQDKGPDLPLNFIVRRITQQQRNAS